MNDLETKQAIAKSLAGFADKPMVDAATALFESLGYKSQKRISLNPNTPETFVAPFANPPGGFPKVAPRRDNLGLWAGIPLGFADRYVIAVKVIDIFGNDTMTLMPVTVG